MSDPIGHVARLQVQRCPLRRDARYDPSPLLPVEAAAISTRGLLGLAGGGWVVDAHHADHPDVRGRGLRPLSVGFSSHYAAMASRFGDVPLGVAGENVVIETERTWTADDLASGVIIETIEGSQLLLESPRPAEPCLEFTSFLLGLPVRAHRDQVLPDLDFLSGGMRGFIVDVGRVRKMVRNRSRRSSAGRMTTLFAPPWWDLRHLGTLSSAPEDGDVHGARRSEDDAGR